MAQELINRPFIALKIELKTSWFNTDCFRAKNNQTFQIDFYGKTARFIMAMFLLHVNVIIAFLKDEPKQNTIKHNGVSLL